MIGMLSLLLFYLLSALFEHCYLRKNNAKTFYLRIWNFILLFPTWIMISFRSLYVGNDTKMYMYLYESFKKNDLIYLLQNHSMDKGFIILNKIVSNFGFDYIVFQFIIASITCAFFSWFIYKFSINFGFSWFLFVTLLFFSRSMNISREMLAVGISLYAFKLLLDKKIFAFILLIIILSFIHKSSIILLLAIPFVFFKKEKFRKFLFICSCIVIALYFSNIMTFFIDIFGKYGYLTDSKYIDVSGGIAQYFNMILALFVFIIFKRNKNRCLKKSYQELIVLNSDIKHQDKVWNSYLYLSLIICVAGFKFGLADRTALYFSSISLILIPNYILKEKNANIRCVLLLMTTTLLSLYFISVLLYRNDWHTTLPYSFIWN